jgi:DNA-binding response OmpR family regulator
MNDPPSDENENENVIDIFIVSNDETVAHQLTDHLAQREYRVTVFTDSAQLNEALRAGKPNLLICDGTTEKQEGFEICRQIKADNDLWVIPVLILTAACALRDLLNVLDSNADNFIAHPYDFPYFHLLVEGMLATPVERPTPDQIKTQFKISHDDRTYVVAANRRKLLEYLLSAFEIAVNKSSELSHVTADLYTLSDSVKELEKSVTGHTHVIEILNATIQQKEQKIVALTWESKELEQVLAQKTDEVDNLMKERDADKTLITTSDETIRTTSRELEEARADNRSKTDAHTSQLSTLTAGSAALKTNLDTVQHALDEETTRSSSLEKSFRALTLEHEQQKSAFTAEKNRAVSAKQELAALMQAKKESEQDLTRIITDLNETAKQQAAELIRLKGELETETNHRVLTENQVVTLQREYEQSESSFHAETGALNRQVDTLQEKLTASAVALDKEESIITLQKEHLAGIITEKEKTEERLQFVLQELAEARDAVASGEQKRRALVNNLEEVIAEKEKSEQQTKTLSTALDQAQSDIESEKGQRRSVEETLDRTTRERDTALGTLRQEYDGVQTDLDSHKVSLAERERDLNATTTIRVALERDLEDAKARNRALEDELNLAARYRTQSGQQSRALSDELEQVKAALETERRLRRISEEKTKAAAQQQEDLEQRLRTTHDEVERAKKDREATQRQFKEELETASHQIKSLESHVRTFKMEKMHAEKEVPADRAETQKENLELVISKEPPLPVPVKHVSQSLTIEVPAVLPQSPVSEKDPDSGGSSGEVSRIFSGVIPRVPDISGADTISLEHQPEAKNVGPAPEPATANVPAEKNTVDESSPEISPETSPTVDDENEPSDSDVEAQPGNDDEEEPEEGGDEAVPEEESGKEPEEYGGAVPPGGISFNRKQWMDLLKWAHHSGALSQDQRLKIVRMGRLIQKDRRLTKKQQDQVSEVIAVVYALGYRPQ